MKPDRVQVYRNLHNGLLSVRDKKSRKVICHAHGILLEDCKFHVGVRGRERVLREGVKNVHAWVEGTPRVVQGKQFRNRSLEVDYDPSGLAIDLTRDFTYNPFRNETFVDMNGNPLYNAQIVWLYVPPSGGLLCKYGQMTMLTP